MRESYNLPELEQVTRTATQVGAHLLAAGKELKDSMEVFRDTWDGNIADTVARFNSGTYADLQEVADILQRADEVIRACRIKLEDIDNSGAWYAPGVS